MKPHFEEIDADHNGTIDIEETKKFMKSININPAFAPRVLEICDTNKDCQISFDEFGPYFKLRKESEINSTQITIVYLIKMKFVDYSNSSVMQSGQTMKLKQ